MFSAKPTASVRIACRPLNENDAEVQEIKRDDDEYDQIMTTKHIDTTQDPNDKTKVVQIRKHSHLFMEAILFGKKDVKNIIFLSSCLVKNLAFISFNFRVTRMTIKLLITKQTTSKENQETDSDKMVAEK